MSVSDKMISFALRFLNYFEPFTRFGISYYVNRQLKQYKQRGLVAAYKTRVMRLGKWHYRVEVSLDLTSSQAARIVRLLVGRLRGLRR